MLEEPRADPEEKQGPASDVNIGKVEGLKALDLELPNREEPHPKWVHKTLHVLDQEAGGNALKGLPVVVSHIKYSLTDEQPQEAIRKELKAGNDLGLQFLIPEQGALYHFQ